MFNLFYKSWIWYQLGVIIVFIYVRLAFSFFYLLTLLICVRFSSTAPCTSAWAPHFCSLGPKRKTREIPKGGIFFSFFFNFSFFNITIHKDWHFFHSTPETLTVTKTKKNTIAQFQFHKGRGLQRWGRVGVKASTTLGTQGGSAQPAAGCVHTYHSYINIMWY